LKIDHLRYFLAAATYNSFSSAGANLNISPTSIGYAVDLLEQQLGTSLFVRKPSKGLTLTNDGLALQERARLILSEMESIATQFKGHENQFRGDLIVGCHESLTWSLLPRAIKTLVNRHPDLRISIKTTELASNFHELAQGNIDVLLSFQANSNSVSKFQVTELWECNLMAMMRKGHPLDNGTNPLTFKDLSQFPHILNSEPMAFNAIYQSFKTKGHDIKIGYMSDTNAGTQAIVGMSDCVAVRVLRPATNTSPIGDELIFKTIKESTARPSIIAAQVSSSSNGIRTKRDAFIEVCKELFESGEMTAHLA